MSRPLRRTALLAAALCLAGPLGTLSTAGAASAAGAVDLTVTQAAVDRASVPAGGTLAVTLTEKAKGGRARKSVTRFYLSPDPAGSLRQRRRAAVKAKRKHQRITVVRATGDILLTGSVPVRPITAGKKRPAGAVVTVPATVIPATYALLACADDTGRLRERREDDNCRIVTRSLVVTPATGATGMTGQQIPIIPEPTGPVAPLRSLLDLDEWPDSAESDVDYYAQSCNDTTPAAPMTESVALASLRNVLTTASADGMARVAAMTATSTAVAVQEYAGAAMLRESPGLALAFVLRAHELEPTVGSHLVNAAALAVTLGHPNEAIALLDAAVGKQFRHGPMATSNEAVAAVVRGQALLMTGRLGPARDQFLQAKAGDPALSEADAGLAAVAACQDATTDAARYARRSWQRSDTPLQSADPVVPRTEVLDLSHGTATELRDLPLPSDASEAAALASYYDSAEQAIEDESAQASDELDDLYAHLAESDETRPAPYVEIRRRERLMDLLDEMPADAQQSFDLAWDAYDRVENAQSQFAGQWQTLVFQSNASCSGSLDSTECAHLYRQARCSDLLTPADTAWRDAMADARTAWSQWVELRTTAMSARSAHLAGTDAHRIAEVETENAERYAASTLLDLADQWSSLLSNPGLVTDCLAGGQDDESPNLPTGPQVQATSCPAGLGDADVRVDLTPITLDRTCERVTLESHESRIEELAQAFEGAGWANRAGTVTVFFGADPAQHVGDVVAGRGAGVYATVAPNDGISDLGYRLAPGVKVGDGPLLVTLSGRYDLAIVPGLAPVARRIVEQPL